MLYRYCVLFLLFFFYSIIGYFIEVISVSLIAKKMVLSRGFLIGPYLPIYGVGSIIITCFLQKYHRDLLALFVMGTVLCSILEYFTSYIMEKLFRLRFWDYSFKKFNLNGRISLENSIMFGIGGVLLIEFINPIVKRLFMHLFPTLVIVLGLLFTFIFLIDLVVSTVVIFQLKSKVVQIEKGDATGWVRNEVRKVLQKNVVLTNRLLNSFPHLFLQDHRSFDRMRKLLTNVMPEIHEDKSRKKEK